MSSLVFSPFVTRLASPHLRFWIGEGGWAIESTRLQRTAQTERPDRALLLDLVVYVVSAAAFLVKGDGRVVVAESARLAVETRVALDLVGAR